MIPRFAGKIPLSLEKMYARKKVWGLLMEVLKRILIRQMGETFILSFIDESG